MSNPIVKTHHYVSRDVLINAAWEVKCDPTKRLSKKSVLDLVATIYSAYGDQVNVGTFEDYGMFLLNSTDWTDSQRDKIEDWVDKQWPGVGNA